MQNPVETGTKPGEVAEKDRGYAEQNSATATRALGADYDTYAGQSSGIESSGAPHARGPPPALPPRDHIANPANPLKRTMG